MTIEPIPDSLLGDEIVVLKPDQNGWTECTVSNVRAEKTNAVENGYSNPQEKTRLIVWYDFVNSNPKALDIASGMRIRFEGEIFDIVSVKVYRAETPHHIKISAVKIGEFLEEG